MFLDGWFLSGHVSLKVLWWLAFATEISIPFSFVPSSCRGSGCCSIKVLWCLAFAIEISMPVSFVPSSCRGSGCCSVSEDVLCSVGGARFWFDSFVPTTVVMRIPSKVI